MKLLNEIETIYPQNCMIELNKDTNKKKFNWTLLNIKWFLSAEGTTDFYDEAIKIMKPCMKDSKTVIDIGCGIGTFSIQLSMKGLEVTSIDISSTATTLLKKRIKNNSIKNIDVFNTAFEFMSDKDSYDIVLISYVMGLINENNIEKILNFSNKYIVLILPIDEIKDDFSITELYKRIGIDVDELKQQTYKQILRVFNKLGIKYDLKIFQSEFGQPFNSKEEAFNFIQYYFKIPMSEKIETIKWIEEKLIKKNGRYYLPNKKRSAMILVEK